MKSVPSLIGVIHLPPLPGSPDASGLDPGSVLQRAGLLAVKEAQLLSQTGFDGLVLENFGDTPFYKTEVPPETVASLAIIAAAVRETTRARIAINVLRNDARSAMAIAAVCGCEMIRVNVLSGVAATDQGLIEGDAAFLLRERARLGAQGVSILADVHVKHGKSLSSDDIGLAVEEAALRGRASAVVVTGATTGRAVDLAALRRATEVAGKHGVPVLIGSGARRDNLAELLKLADGVIVGSDLRRNGRAGAPLDPKRVREFAKAFQKAGKPAKIRRR
jgi:uncharacterized protein